jgi:hypothetical protein
VVGDLNFDFVSGLVYNDTSYLYKDFSTDFWNNLRINFAPDRVINMYPVSIYYFNHLNLSLALQESIMGNEAIANTGQNIPASES